VEEVSFDDKSTMFAAAKLFRQHPWAEVAGIGVEYDFIGWCAVSGGKWLLVVGDLVWIINADNGEHSTGLKIGSEIHWIGLQ
jgi:hypothetical protein